MNWSSGPNGGAKENVLEEHREQEVIRLQERFSKGRRKLGIFVDRVEETKGIDPRCVWTHRPFSTENGEQQVLPCHQLHTFPYYKSYFVWLSSRIWQPK